MTRSLRSLLKPLLGLSTALVFLLGVEGLLWLLGIPSGGLYAGDLKSVWWLRPDLDTTQRLVEEDLTFSIQTNGLGLRGPLPPAEGPWTLALGCSTTFGWGVEAEEAWPAVLSALTGQAVVNGGTPGWSTHQAVLGAQRWLDHGPDRVVLGYLVRDAQRAMISDADAAPTPWLLRTHIGQLLVARLKPATTSLPRAPASLPTVRVSLEAYRANLSRLVEMSGDAEVIVLAFPHQEARLDPWADALSELSLPLLAPQLGTESFFASDPIHLNSAGHRRLAEQLAADPRLRSTPPLRR